MNKFPFKVYKIATYQGQEKTKLPKEELKCKDCGNLCGHLSTWVYYETKEVNRSYIREYKVVGSNNQEYFVSLTSGDEVEELAFDSITTISQEESFLTEEEARAEMERLGLQEYD